MRIQRSTAPRLSSSSSSSSASSSTASSPLSLLATLLLLPALAAAATSLDCSHLRDDGVGFDLSKLGGPHSVMTSVYNEPALLNTTWTIDICSPLKRSKGVKKNDQCPNGSRVCGIERTINAGDDADIISKVITVAGDVMNSGGGRLDASWTRLSTSSSNADAEKEGLRIELHGGAYPLSSGRKEARREQRAVVEFLCDPARTGLEGDYEGEDKYERSRASKEEQEKEKKKKKRGALAERKDEEGDDDDDKKKADGDDDDEEDPDDGDDVGTPSLEFVSYGSLSEDSKIDVLRLNWRTKYACEKRDDGDDGGDSSGATQSWGFFTWFIIIVFLGVAAYLIFGSWLNYNRYGARGWDLVPHGDTIRDVPYLMKDWTRRVINTVQGSGSRGGYSAV